MQNLKENWLIFSKITWIISQIFTGRKIAISFYKVMVELNQNQNSKQLDRPDAVRKLCLTLETND